MTSAVKKISKNLYKYIIVLFLITLFLRIVFTVCFDSDYGGIEQNVIYGIQRIIMGQPLYQDPATGTYAVMQYTPLYYYFTSGIAKFSGIYATDVQSIYTLCRIIALTFNLLTVVTVALIIRSWRFSRSCSLVFAMPVLMLLTSHYYTRGDSMHLFLFIAAMYSYILYNKNGGLWHILLAALFSAGCIMVKQNGILVIGIIGFCLLFADRKYLSAIFYSLCTSCFTCFLAEACIRGNWHAFYQNTYLGLKNGMDISFLYRIFTSQFFFDMVPCYILGGIIVWLAMKKITDNIFRRIATGAALSFLFAIITGLKIGSANNYFTEFLVFVITALPYLLQSEQGAARLFRFFDRTVTIYRFAYIAFFILITSKTAGFVTEAYNEINIKNFKTEYNKEKELYEYFRKGLNIKNGEYIFFTDRLFFDNIFIEHAIMPNKDVVEQVYAANHTTFDYSAFVAGMNTGMIKYIVTDENKKDINKWNRYIPFILFHKDKFRLLTNYLGYSVYVYSPGPL